MTDKNKRVDATSTGSKNGDLEGSSGRGEVGGRPVRPALNPADAIAVGTAFSDRVASV